MDQLKAAAAAVDAAGAPWSTISEELAATVEDVELGPVLDALLAGLPSDLLQPVILVTSDLASRRAAMESFTIPRAAGDPQPYDLLADLGNGHDAAQRFDADLAATRAAARGHAPVTYGPTTFAFDAPCRPTTPGRRAYMPAERHRADRTGS
jgi:hypothetical protein